MPVCRKCTALFPNSIRIDGDRRSLQNRKFCLSCSPYKLHNTKDLSIAEWEPVERRCPRCEQTLSISQFYRRRGKEGHAVYCKSCTNRQAVERQQAMKRLAVEYKGGAAASAATIVTLAASSSTTLIQMARTLLSRMRRTRFSRRSRRNSINVLCFVRTVIVRNMLG